MMFTVVHPDITSHDARLSSDEPRSNWLVDDYFAAASRELDRLGGRVVWHHRTIEQYVLAVQRAAFRLTALCERALRVERFAGDAEELARRRQIPLFLLLVGDR